MKLKQTISVDGTVRDNWTNSSDDIFAQLSLAGHAVHAARRDIPATWLQERTDLLFIMGCLFATGRVSIFSLEDKIRVDIRWEFESQQSNALLASESPPVSEAQQPAEVESAQPAEPIHNDTFQDWLELCKLGGINFPDRRIAYYYFNRGWDLTHGPSDAQWAQFKETHSPEIVALIDAYRNQI